MSKLLDDFVGRRAGRRENHAHAADLLRLTRGVLVAAAVEDDRGLIFFASEIRNVFDEHLTRPIQDIVLVVGSGSGDVLIAATASQHVEAVDDQNALAILRHQRASFDSSDALTTSLLLAAA